MKDQIKIVSALLEKAAAAKVDNKINVKFTTVDENTALHWAVSNENLDMVNLLLANGANVKQSNKNKKSALDLAADRNNLVIMNQLGYKQKKATLSFLFGSFDKRRVENRTENIKKENALRYPL